MTTPSGDVKAGAWLTHGPDRYVVAAVADDHITAQAITIDGRPHHQRTTVRIPTASLPQFRRIQGPPMPTTTSVTMSAATLLRRAIDAGFLDPNTVAHLAGLHPTSDLDGDTVTFSPDGATITVTVPSENH